MVASKMLAEARRSEGERVAQFLLSAVPCFPGARVSGAERALLFVFFRGSCEGARLDAEALRARARLGALPVALEVYWVPPRARPSARAMRALANDTPEWAAWLAAHARLVSRWEPR